MHAIKPNFWRNGEGREPGPGGGAVSFHRGGSAEGGGFNRCASSVEAKRETKGDETASFFSLYFLYFHEPAFSPIHSWTGSYERGDFELNRGGLNEPACAGEAGLS